MQDTHTLTRHRDIQNWVTDRRGTPAIRRLSNSMGEVRSRLAIQFGAPPSSAELTIDDGIMPVSWSAWLAELDRQELALKVTAKSDFEFVKRRDMH